MLMILLPFILTNVDYWRHTEGFHEELEWEYVVNEVFKLVQQYDYFSPYNANNIRISLYKEETIQNYTGYEYARADAYLTIANNSIILSKNTGTEPIIYSSMTFSLESKDNGFTIRQSNEAGEIKERHFYMRRVLN